MVNDKLNGFNNGINASDGIGGNPPYGSLYITNKADKKLYRVTTNVYNPYDDTYEIELSYIISDLSFIENEKPIPRDEARNSELFIYYNEFELIGDISDSEISTLEKFNFL